MQADAADPLLLGPLAVAAAVGVVDLPLALFAKEPREPRPERFAPAGESAIGHQLVHEAKTHLSRLLERVTAGEEIVIARAGTPVAKLVAYGAPEPRKLGTLAGKIWAAPDWDSPEVNEEITRLFEGEED